MSAYVPTVLAGAFLPAPVNTNFNAIRTAINAALDANNFAALSLTHRAFRPNALTETFVASGGDTTAVFPIAFNIAGRTYPTGLFEVANTGLRFHCPTAPVLAQFHMHCLVNKFKAEWLAGAENFIPQLAAHLVVDGTTVQTRNHEWTELAVLVAGQNEKRGCSVHVAHSMLALGAGWHTAHLWLSLAGSTTTHATGNIFAQGYSGYRGASVRLYYR